MQCNVLLHCLKPATKEKETQASKSRKGRSWQACLETGLKPAPLLGGVSSMINPTDHLTTLLTRCCQCIGWSKHEYEGPP